MIVEKMESRDDFFYRFHNICSLFFVSCKQTEFTLKATIETTYYYLVKSAILIEHQLAAELFNLHF